MTDETLDDPVLLAVRAARPAAPPDNDSSSSRRAQLALDQAMSSHPRSSTHRNHGRFAGWGGRAVPVFGVLTAIAVVVVAFGALGRRHRPPSAPAGSGTTLTLSASQYAFAVGGDSSPRTARAQASGGLVLLRANQVLRGRCMAQRGFLYTRDPIPRTSDLPSVTGYPSTFYPQPLTSAYPEAALLALREREGFGVVSSRRSPEPNDQYLKTLSPARRKLWRNAWTGRNGCYGLAEVQLFGSRRAANLEQDVPVKIYNYLNTIVYTQSGTVSPSNPRTADTAAAWSRCMQTTTGHAWADENALINSLGNDSSEFAARRLAVADTQCACSTGQAQAFAAAFRHAADHLPAGTQPELRFLLAHRHAWIVKADRILTSSKP